MAAEFGAIPSTVRVQVPAAVGRSFRLNVPGKLRSMAVEAFFKDNVLLDQPFVKDDTKTIQSLLDEVGAKTGEKVAVRRFTRYRLGEDLE